MRKTLSIIVLTIFLLCSAISLLFSATLDQDNPKTEKQYTDTNKKILNVGGSYYHNVKKGDTVWGILMRDNQTDPNYYDYYLKEFIKLNPQVKNVNKIFVGDTLLIPDILHKRKFIPKKAKAKKPKPKKIAAKKKEQQPEAKKESPKKKETEPEKKAAAEKPKPKEPPKKKGKEQPKKSEAVKAEKKPTSKEKTSTKKVAASQKEGKGGKVSKIVEKSGKTKAGKGDTALIGPTLERALEGISEEVVTKGIQFFPLADGRSLKLDNSKSPMVNTSNKKVIMDYGDNIKKEDEDYITNKYAYYGFVDIHKGETDEEIVDKVLKASGYYSIREDKEIKVGKNVKLVINYDWLVEESSESFMDGNVKLLKVETGEEGKVPLYIKTFLEKRGFFVSEVNVIKKGEKVKVKKKTGEIISLGESNSTQKLIRSLLGFVNIKHKENITLNFHSEKKNEINADIYFEKDSKGYIINLKPISPDLKELAEKYEIKLLELYATSDRNEIMKMFFDLLQKSYKYGTYRLLSEKAGKPFLDVEAKGFLVSEQMLTNGPKSEKNYDTLPEGDNIFVTQYNVPDAIKRLLTDYGFKVTQK